jgi:hypothetical protein
VDIATLHHFAQQVTQPAQPTSQPMMTQFEGTPGLINGSIHVNGNSYFTIGGSGVAQQLSAH